MKKTQLYNAHWDKVCKAFIARNHLCVMCQESDLINLATVVDHIVPHHLHFAQTAEEVKIAQKCFWDEKNWQPLCAQHHNTTK
ncbi:HNH endonuclease [Serratia symbiotica]|nr:HNH endonuclease [Serratia symbiotica]